MNIPTATRVGLGIALDREPPSSRIKSFQLLYAIKYSYYRDIRFILFLLYGFTIWIILAPDPLLNKPGALCSPNLKVLINWMDRRYLFKPCL